MSLPSRTLSHRCAVLSFALLSPLSAIAQGAPTAREPYSMSVGKQVVDSMATMLRARYADADTGAMIADHVQRRWASGAYSRVTGWDQFVRLVTQDLQAVNEDTHLFLQLAGGPGGAGPGAPTGPQAHGVEAVERLAGNIGYFRMTNFLGSQAAFNALKGALDILSVTDAIIIDLRNSRGGSPAVANFIISHFTGPDTVLSLLVYDRASNTTTSRYTMRDVPGPRRIDVPLFILTDDVTRSAAEDLTFVLQNFKRATVVGTRTAGAGRNNATVPLGHGVVGSISFTRVMEPGTRREWERTGITPDIPTHRDSALVVAHREAMKRIMAGAQPAARTQLELVLQGIEARYAALRRSARRLTPPAGFEQYVGTYEGDQTIVLTGDHLVYQPRVAQPRETLSSLGNATFASGSVRYRFSLSGNDATLTILGPDNSTSTFRRVSKTVADRRK
jgi:hypothetical protein